MNSRANKRPLEPEQFRRARACLTPKRALPALIQLQRIVCESTRAQIIAALRAGPLPVEDIALLVGRAPAATSQHLRVLRNLGTVRGLRRNRRVYYELLPGSTTERAIRVLTDLEQSA
jgi:DNA-binding transcriptional ArsR family regulator